MALLGAWVLGLLALSGVDTTNTEGKPLLTLS